MSTLRVDKITLNDTGNAFIAIANSWNVSIVTDGVERLRIDNTGVPSITAAFNKANTALSNTGGTITGDLRVLGTTDFQDRYSAVANATTNTINCIVANYFTRTITASETITFINPPSSGNAYGMVLELANAGSFTITWANTPKWPGNTAPTLTGGSGNTDILVFLTRDGGTTWRGTLSQKDSR